MATTGFVLEVDQSAEFCNELLLLFSEPLIDASGRHFGDQYPGLQLEDEIEILREVAGHSPARIQINIAPATSDRIRQTFARDFSPLILHFIGRGIQFDTETTALVAEDAVGRAKVISVNDLLRLLDSLTPPCQLAVLNCCHSGAFARALTCAGVAHVVTVNAPERVFDAACHTFAKHFYPAIFSGQEVQSAFEFARAAVYEDDRVRLLLASNSAGSATLEEVLEVGLYPENSLEHQKQLSIEGDPGDVLVLEETDTNLSRRNMPFGLRKDL